MTFQTFLETKYPLYSDPQMKVNLTVQQVCELVEEWEKSKVKKLSCPKCGTGEENHKRMGEHVYCCECEYEWNWG